MRTIEATVVMDAPPSVVWDVLVTGEDYAGWNPLITELSDQLIAGARPRLCIAPPGKRETSFRPPALDAAPGVRLCRAGRLGPPGLCDGEQEFLLVATDSGGTQLTQRENLRQVLVPLLGSMLEPTGQGFEEMTRPSVSVPRRGRTGDVCVYPA
jgi:hypothetical protein